MPVISGVVSQQESPISIILKSVLNSALAWQQGKQDRAYRVSAAKLLGVDPASLGYFKREEIKELIKKKKFESQEWKPQTREEYEWAKGLEAKNKKFSDTFEENIKYKDANGIPLTENEVGYFNRHMRKTYEAERVYTKPISEVPGDSDKPQGFSIGNALRKLITAMTPTKIGGPEIELPGIAPANASTQTSQAVTVKSPYPEYPDAFMENGVWKVIRDGTKYRIED